MRTFPTLYHAPSRFCQGLARYHGLDLLALRRQVRGAISSGVSDANRTETYPLNLNQVMLAEEV